MTWFSRAAEPRQQPFGPLEWRVLCALWDRNRPASVRDLQPEFTDIAYITIRRRNLNRRARPTR
jgi:hypothetical protein